MDANRNPKSLSECYFAGKGTALVLPAAEALQCTSRRSDAQQGSNIGKHLQSIVNLLRAEETLKMAVKLESVHPLRVRYLVIVSRKGERGEESCLLGIDCNDKTTVGLVLKVMADTTIRLDGDGGFSVSVCGRHHIFKPVSVQAMWSALQTLHKVSSKATQQNYFQGGLSHAWVAYYEDRIESDRSCLNEWHAMDNLESKRPPSPDSIRHKPTERQETENVIRTTLKEIMMSVDLDEVTSKYIRTRLEEDLDMDLGEYKSFIDEEMLKVLGQMDAPTEIFEHVYLGSEWNASNYEELQRNGVGHILNVTREIDNFFPHTFKYFNVRVYDDEKTDLLKHWDDTFKYITKAKMNGSKVLVHCKMGVSRSASVVIAYAMKAYNWDFATAMRHVKDKRTCIKPNTNFLTQLETYQGILDAMKNKEKLQRSKSETNLKSNSGNNNNNNKLDKSVTESAVPIKIVTCLTTAEVRSGFDLRTIGARPKSWSPDDDNSEQEPARISEKSPAFLSLEDLSQKTTVAHNRHFRMPCDNGESYSVSPNRIVHLKHEVSVKERISELESSRTIPPPLKTWDPGENLTTSETVWTAVVQNTSSSSSSGSANNNGDTLPKDPFSNHLDRVFDREEQHNLIPVLRDCPSRQSSWSSYDSAVGSQNDVMGLSRHSSWGSGDTRVLPSRNSSWGSYDMRPRGPVHYINEKGEKVVQNPDVESSSSGIFPYDKEDIPWHPGTVKRTKQRIEDIARSSSDDPAFELAQPGDEKPAEAVNRCLVESEVKNQVFTSAISTTIAIPPPRGGAKSTHDPSRLSVSAPERSSLITLMGDVDESDKRDDCSLSKSVSNLSTIKPVEAINGKVKSLKMEFEAKTGSSIELIPEVETPAKKDKESEKEKSAVASLPSSPLCVHHEREVKKDLNFKSLLGIFENNKEVVVCKRPKVVGRTVTTRHSCTEPIKVTVPVVRGESRPPISPVVRNSTATPSTLYATLMAKTKKQQQYGRSHPVTRLMKSRHNNPLYNTM